MQQQKRYKIVEDNEIFTYRFFVNLIFIVTLLGIITFAAQAYKLSKEQDTRQEIARIEAQQIAPEPERILSETQKNIKNKQKGSK